MSLGRSDNPTKTIVGNAQDSSKMETMSKTLIKKAGDQAYPATLTIRGRPDISPMSFIKILVLTRSGYVHHSTGAYYIEKVTNEISNGEYTTTLHLYKNLAPSPDLGGDDAFDSSTTSSGNFQMTGQFSNPLPGGSVTQEWRGSSHLGVDISSGGSTLFASGNGIVIYSGPGNTRWSHEGVGVNDWSYGNNVVIDHGTNSNGQRIITRYAHMRSVKVKAGQRVRAGHVIGIEGSTGVSTGTHVHFEVWVNGSSANPRNYMKLP